MADPAPPERPSTHEDPTPSAAWQPSIAAVVIVLGALIAIFTAKAFSASVALAILGVATGTAVLIHRSAVQRRESATRDLGARINSIGDSVFFKRPLTPAERATDPDASKDPPTLDWLAEQIDARADALATRVNWVVEARASLRAIIDGIDSPVVATDEQGLVRVVNRAAERIFGRRAGRLTGQPLEELLPQQSLLDLHDKAREGQACAGEIRLAQGESVRTYTVNAQPVRIDIQDLHPTARPRAGVVLTLRDITELAQTTRLRTDFVANASHELRTPIAAIRGAVETIKGPAADDPPMRERLVAMVESHTHRLEDMVSDLLDLSNLESEERPVKDEPVRASEIAEALHAIFDTKCRDRDLELAFELDPRLERMRSDPSILMLMLRNLVDNASKYAFPETTIRVTGEVIEPPQPERPQDTQADEPPPLDNLGRATALFRVIDKGEGIPIKHHARIFERFYQVDESRTRKGARKGTGLGLAIVKHAAKRLGGQVSVDSVWQQGTTMTIELPACVERREATSDNTND